MLIQILDKFLANRKLIGLSFLLFGGPIIYFFRDGLALAPGSSLVTAVCTVISIVLITPMSNYNFVFKPNKVIYYLTFCYLGIAIFYLFFYKSARCFANVPYELVNYTLLIMLFVFILTISDRSFEESFLKITLIICILGCVFLLLYLFRTGYTFGKRAAIQFATAASREFAEAGNPHIFSRTAYALFCCGLMFWKHESFVWKWLGIGGTFLGLMVVGMTQTFATFIALGMVLLLFLMARYSVGKVFRRIFGLIFNPRGIMVMVGLIASAYYAVNFTGLSRFYNGLVAIIDRRLSGMINLVFKNPDALKKAAALTKNPVIDSSASSRVDNLNEMFENFGLALDYGNPLPYVFGFGYMDFYVDSPVFQAWNDMGIVSFLLYATILVVVVWTSYHIIKHQISPARQFVAYFMMLMVIYSFTFGMPYGTYLWFYFAFAARFLKADPLDKGSAHYSSPSAGLENNN